MIKLIKRYYKFKYQLGFISYRRFLMIIMELNKGN